MLALEAYLSNNGLVANIKNFGAVGDGIVDDTLAIQSAIDSIPMSGGLVFLPVGIYKISAPLILKSNLSFVGASRFGAHIRNAANSTTFSATVSPGSQLRMFT